MSTSQRMPVVLRRIRKNLHCITQPRLPPKAHHLRSLQGFFNFLGYSVFFCRYLLLDSVTLLRPPGCWVLSAPLCFFHLCNAPELLPFFYTNFESVVVNISEASASCLFNHHNHNELFYFDYFSWSNRCGII